MVPFLAKPANLRRAVRAGLISPGQGKGQLKGQWLVRSPSALAMMADLVASGVAASVALALFENIASALGELGRVVANELAAVELAAIEPGATRTALLHRNRPLLGRTAATLLIAAIGEALPDDDTDRIRIGAVRQTNA